MTKWPRSRTDRGKISVRRMNSVRLSFRKGRANRSARFHTNASHGKIHPADADERLALTVFVRREQYRSANLLTWNSLARWRLIADIHSVRELFANWLSRREEWPLRVSRNSFRRLAWIIQELLIGLHRGHEFPG